MKRRTFFQMLLGGLIGLKVGRAVARSPLRVSVDKSDPGYRWDAFNYEAYLNGAPLRHCVTADEGMGEAVLLVRHDGKFLISGGEVVREVRRGRVEIRLRTQSSVLSPQSS